MAFEFMAGSVGSVFKRGSVRSAAGHGITFTTTPAVLKRQLPVSTNNSSTHNLITSQTDPDRRFQRSTSPAGSGAPAPKPAPAAKAAARAPAGAALVVVLVPETGVAQLELPGVEVKGAAGRGLCMLVGRHEKNTNYTFGPMLLRLCSRWHSGTNPADPDGPPPNSPVPQLLIMAVVMRSG